MFSSLTTKLALKKMGLPSDALNLSMPDIMGNGDAAARDDRGGSNKLRKSRPSRNGSVSGPDHQQDDNNNGNDGGAKAWPAWMSVKALPLSMQPWLTPAPAPIPVAAAPPQKGDNAPLDRDRKLVVGGGGKPVVVVFLRCVGCALTTSLPAPFLPVAQKTFLNLRTLANRHAGQLTCIAVSHSSRAATQKWLDLLGGAWNVQIVIDEDRSVYAAWGLGLGSVWYVLNPTTQIQAWRQTGWLGQTVAGYMEQRRPEMPTGGAAASTRRDARSAAVATTKTTSVGADDAADEGPTTVMGNKWQQAGAFAVNSQGVVLYGQKATRADDLLNLDLALASLGL